MLDARGVKHGLFALGIVFALGASAPAFAAETIGQTFAPQNQCGEASTNLQTTSPGDSYAASSDGIITSWSFMAPAVVPSQIKFKAGHQVSAGSFQIAGQSPLKTPVASTLNTYTDIRVAVEEGDVIGLYLPDQMMCGTNPTAGYDYHFFAGDAPLGLSALWTFGGGVRFDISAQLEADADGDGFGDETQDECPTDASTQGQCSGPPDPPAVPDTDPPETTITKDPPKKTDKHKVKFAFKADERGSSFECQFDGKSVDRCTSPVKFKHLDKGKHKFKVWAIDSAGNVDLSAAQDKFKIVG